MMNRRDFAKYFAAGTIITPAVALIGEARPVAKLVEEPKLIEVATELPKCEAFNVGTINAFSIYFDTPSGTRKLRSKRATAIFNEDPRVAFPEAQGGDEVYVSIRIMKLSQSSPQAHDFLGILKGKGIIV